MNKNNSTLTISQYISSRIANNAYIYQNKIGNAPDQFDVKKVSSNIFQLLYFVIYQHFLNGNTLLLINDNKLVKKSFFGNGHSDFDIVLSHWQFLVIDLLLNQIELSVKDGNDFCQKLLQKINDNLIMLYCVNDEHIFTNMARDFRENRKKLIESIGIQKYDYQLMNLMYFLYYFLYLIKFQFLSSEQFYQYLADKYFCSRLEDNRQETPFVLSDFNHGFGIWFNRAFKSEQALAQDLLRILNNQSYKKLEHITLAGDLNHEQKQAILLSLSSNFVLITGGPGTGKTFTVAQLVIELVKSSEVPPILALTAPTGKAAQRMQESLATALQDLQLDIELPAAKTIHRLIGLGMSGVPRHHAKNPILADVVVVDEASMLDITLACQLFGAIGENTKLILLGDVNQLSAVGAGSVLADLCNLPSLAKNSQMLIESRRFNKTSAIGHLAKFINEANVHTTFDEFLSIMNASQSLCYRRLGWGDLDKPKRMLELKNIYDDLAKNFELFWATCADLYQKSFNECVYDDKDIKKLFGDFLKFRILTATHSGYFGDEQLNVAMSERYLRQYHTIYRQARSEWYHGRCVMVIKNSYELGLFNGDVGICLCQKNHGKYELVVYFEHKAAPIPIALLSGEGLIVSAYAMTVHKSQGSEFDKVAICLMSDGWRDGQLLGRELFYTAVTRAKSEVLLIGDDASIWQAITKKVVRQTGLSHLYERLLV